MPRFPHLVSLVLTPIIDMLRPLPNDFLPNTKNEKRFLIHYAKQAHASTAPLQRPSTSGPQPPVTDSSPGVTHRDRRLHKQHLLSKSHSSATLRPEELSSQSILDQECAVDVSTITTEELAPCQDRSSSTLENIFSLEYNRITAERDVTIASGNVSQQGNGNFNAKNVYIQHVPAEEEHQNVLRQILSSLQSYVVAEATLNKCMHGEPSVCYAGTREKVLEHVLSWVAAGPVEDSVDVSSRALCVVGAPGSGKSTILNTLVIDLLQDAARRRPGLIAAHYCIRRSVHSTTDSSKLLPTLTLQLARRNPGVAKRVSAILDAALQTGFFACHFQEDLFLEAIRAYDKTVFVIIDALDEASHPFSLATALSRVIPHSPANLRLLLATRNEHGVLHGLGENLVPKIVYQIPTEQSIDDVQYYIRRRLSDGVTALFGANPAWAYWPDDSQIRSLSDRAGGLYIWARTAVDYILSKIKRHGKVNRNRWIKDVESLGTADVNRLYMLILENQLESKEEGNQEDDMTRMWITRVLGFIIVVERPLALDDLVGFLNLHNFDVAHFVNMTRSILVPGTEPITGATAPQMHKTFFDFVTTKRAVAFRVDIEDHHSQAATQCFALMDTHLRFNIYGLSSSFQQNNTRTLATRLLYASTNWWYHIQKGYLGLLPAHLVYIQTLLFDKLLFWLEVVSLDNEAFEAAQSCMSGLAKQLRSRTMPRTEPWNSSWRFLLDLPPTTFANRMGLDLLADFADSTLLLMEKFKPCVVENAPHIYVSLLAFSPADSIVASHYRNKVRAMVIPLPHGIPSQWDSWDSIPKMADDGSILSISFSPCGRRLAAGCSKATIWVWDVETAECGMGPLKGHSDKVASVCFSPSGLLIASGSSDDTIRVWDAETGKCMLGPLTGHRWCVSSVSFSPDSARIVSGSGDGTVRAWDVRTGDCVLGPLSVDSHNVNVVSYSPDGSCIAAGSKYGAIRVWNAQTGKCIRGPLERPEPWVFSLSFHPSGYRVVSSSQDRTLRVYSVNLENSICSHGILTGHSENVSSVCFSQEGRYIASSSFDQTIRIWDSETARCVAGPFQIGSTLAFASVAFSPDDKYLAAGSFDGIVRLWELQVLLSSGPRVSVCEDEASKKWDFTEHTEVYRTDRIYMTGHLSMPMRLLPDHDGWTLGPNKERLFWAPKPYRSVIRHPSSVRILGLPLMITPDLSNLVTGEEWLQCFPTT